MNPQETNHVNQSQNRTSDCHSSEAMEFGSIISGWYLVRSKANCEHQAFTHLVHHSISVYCPYLKQSGKKHVMFPGYIFVYLSSQSPEQYYRVRHSPGVINFVCFSSSSDLSRSHLPKPIPRGERVIAEVREIARQHQMFENQKVSDTAIMSGDQLTLNGKLFRGLQATFIKNTNADRGLVLLRHIQRIRQQNTIKDCTLSEKCIELPLSQMSKTEGSD